MPPAKGSGKRSSPAPTRSMLKVINNAGHELYAGNPAEAGKFNMSILHRQAPPAAAPDAVPVSPAAPAPAPAAS